MIRFHLWTLKKVEVPTDKDVEYALVAKRCRIWAGGHDELRKSVNLIFRKVKDLWSLVQLGLHKWSMESYKVNNVVNCFCFLDAFYYYILGWGLYLLTSNAFLTPGFCSGPPWDLYVYLDVEDVKGIQRDGINLSSSVSISYIDAILGSVVKVLFLCYLSLSSFIHALNSWCFSLFFIQRDDIFASSNCFIFLAILLMWAFMLHYWYLSNLLLIG